MRLLEEPRVNYDDFKADVREVSQRGGPAPGLVALPELRRTLAERIARQEFDAFVLRLHADGLVHLMSHVEPETLSHEIVRDCLADETGLLLYWLRWL